MTLGYSATRHRAAAKSGRKTFFKNAKVAQAAAKRGACATAIKALTEAAAWHGVAVAERQGTGAKGQGPTKAYMVKTAKAVTKGCACKRRK